MWDYGNKTSGFVTETEIEIRGQGCEKDSDFV